MASIEEAKNIIKDNPISGVINFYHSVSKKGQNYVGICPFHADTKPSMSVNDQKGLYKCFACGAGGDAIKFVMDLQNLNFPEAIKDISSKLGIVIEEQHKKKENPKVDMGLRVLTVASKIYKKIAKDHKPKSYTEFLKNRNLNEDSVANFGIGYAPGNNALKSYLLSIKSEKDRDFAMSVAKEMGIVREGVNGRDDYDFFRDRVVFPIWDHFGAVRGFSSRAVLDNQKPKYLNSGESFIFDKGNILYGQHIAKTHIRDKDQVILVEGNMDTVVMHQFGFNNTVGSMGTAFSENSAKVLSNITKHIYLAMDNDDAGMQGMIRANDHFMKQGVLPKFLSFAPLKDPDDFLNEKGRLELMDRIEKAPVFIDVVIDNMIPKPIPSATDQKLDLLNEIFALLSPLNESLLAIEKAINASSTLGLKSSSDDISNAYRDYIKSEQAKKQRYAQYKTNRQQEAAPPLPPEPEYFEQDPEEQFINEASQPENLELSKAQEHVISQLIIHPECLQDDQITEILDFIGKNEVERLIRWLKDIYLEIDDSDYINVIKTKLEDDISSNLKNILAKALFDYGPTKLNEKVIKKLLEDLKFNLRKEDFKFKRERLVKQQKQANSEEESKRILRLVSEHDKEFIAFSKANK